MTHTKFLKINNFYFFFPRTYPNVFDKETGNRIFFFTFALFVDEKITNEAYNQKHARANDHFYCDICELVYEGESDSCPSSLFYCK